LKLFEIFGEIKIDDDKANKSLNNIDKKAGKVGKSFSKMSGVIAGAVSIAAVGAFGKKIIDLGANAEEMYNKYNVVFDGMAEDVSKWANQFAKSTGRSKVETEGMLANLADLQQGFGFTQDESFDLSKKIVELGTDLASFNNVQDTTAIEAVSKAMMGEAEMAKQLGLALNVNEVKAYAESQGMVYEELSKGEKMQVTYQLAVEQSQNAIGDAERSAGSYTNQMKALKANLKDTGTEMGMALMPIMTKMVTFVNETVVPGLINFAEKVKNVYLEIKERLQPYIDLMVGFIQDNYPAMEETSTMVFVKIQEVVMQTWDIYKRLFLPILEALIFFVKDNFPAMKETFKTVFNAVIDVVSTLYDWFATYLLPIIENMYAWVAENYPAMKEIFKSVFGSISEVVETLWYIFSEYLLPILGELFAWASENLKPFADFFLDAFGSISEAIEDTIGWFKDVIEWAEKAINKVKEFLDWDKKTREQEQSHGYTNHSPGTYTREPEFSDEQINQMARQEGVDLGVAEGMLKGGKTIDNSITINAKTTVDTDEMENIVRTTNDRRAFELGL